MHLVRSRWAGALALSLSMAAAADAQGPVAAPRGSPDQFTVPATQAPAPISREEFAGRRRALAETLGDGVLLALGALEPESDYMPFSQNSPFRYLTGVTEPGAALVMVKQGGRTREMLFVTPRDPSREVWEGARLGSDAATRLTGIPARSAEGLMAALDSLLSGSVTLYTISPLGSDGSRLEFLRPDQQVVQALKREHPQIRVEDASEKLFRIRSVKSPAELDMLRRSVLITTLAHREAMRAVEPGMNEFEIQALIEATFRRFGAERPSFGSIVGSGPNSTTLHYNKADRFMQAGETLVMDIGSAYNGYAADVTRTVPVSGRFSPEQRQVYEVVLAAQKAAEQQAGRGVSFGAISQTAARVVSEGLARLGLIEAADATYDCGRGGAQKCPQYRLFYMHGLGHGIGLDVHDPEAAYAEYGGVFAVGSAFTIEPGIYVRADVLDYLPDTPTNRAMKERIRGTVERYRNIGVRIEDDYFVTANGVERVTQHAPREIAEIEALMAQESFWNRERRPEIVEWYRGITPH
ncbi:MAG TPA: aminopeptidase P N-terminal domain-containing protein [Longimicrobium sp.]|nr:aminopeptidase P N-terminal domain-containing protein [Longimicrobium sp.]